MVTGRWQLRSWSMEHEEVKFDLYRPGRKRVGVENEKVDLDLLWKDGEEEEMKKEEEQGREGERVVSIHCQEKEGDEYIEMEQLFQETMLWAETNHESLLFSSREESSVWALALDHKQMLHSVHPFLVRLVGRQNFEKKDSEPNLRQILGDLTSVCFSYSFSSHCNVLSVILLYPSFFFFPLLLLMIPSTEKPNRRRVQKFNGWRILSYN